MRGLAWLILLVVTMSFGPRAEAAVLNLCTAGCTTDQFGSLQVDYTIPSNGQAYRWDLWSDASHPTALITLQAPNDIFSMVDTSNGDGTTTQSFTVPDYRWTEIVAPGHTAITLLSGANFDTCASHPAAGTICSVDNSVYGDSVNLKVDVNAPVTITFASTAIPEPAAWSLLIGGFVILGGALRRRRAAGPQAA